VTSPLSVSVDEYILLSLITAPKVGAITNCPNPTAQEGWQFIKGIDCFKAKNFNLKLLWLL
jgi:subtilase family serine protease